MINPPAPTTAPSRPAETTSGITAPLPGEELAKLKFELMKAEVRLAKARANVVGAEVDIKVLNTRLKAAMR